MSLRLVMVLAVTAAAAGAGCPSRAANGGSVNMKEPHVRVTVRGRSLVLTQHDAERMRLALAEALSRSADPLLREEGRRIAADRAFINPLGELDAGGGWLLESRSDDLVLTGAQRHTEGYFVEHVAILEGKPGGDWRVVRIEQGVGETGP